LLVSRRVKLTASQPFSAQQRRAVYRPGKMVQRPVADFPDRWAWKEEACASCVPGRHPPRRGLPQLFVPYAVHGAEAAPGGFGP